jgi:hypothetical protein
MTPERQDFVFYIILFGFLISSFRRFNRHTLDLVSLFTLSRE